jgi:hypothetical protein
LKRKIEQKKFHERVNIEVSLEEARERFVNRVYNEILWGFLLSQRFRDDDRYQLNRAVSTYLGDQFQNTALVNVVGRDLLRNLRAIEGIYKHLDLMLYKEQLVEIVEEILAASEVDLGIQWRDGQFLPSGAKLLDNVLVNDVLHWLRVRRYSSVLDPFEKGLRHLVEARKRKELTADAVTDTYESLEALAKVITGRDRDLSANQELFISKVEVSDSHKKLLRQYIEFANEFRHAAASGKAKPKLSYKEAESFIYLTGLFIRLTITKS